MNSVRLRITSKMTELSFDRQESDYAFYSVMVSSNGEAPLITLQIFKLNNFHFFRSVSDDVINALANNCPDLEQVDVLGTGLIRPHSITR